MLNTPMTIKKNVEKEYAEVESRHGSEGFHPVGPIVAACHTHEEGDHSFHDRAIVVSDISLCLCVKLWIRVRKAAKKENREGVENEGEPDKDHQQCLHAAQNGRDHDTEAGY